jgi:uncharacterized membrane protein YsdA (DUF1294 family)
MLVCSAVLMCLYFIDKRAAKLERRRVPERTLHLWALVGGWPGALLGRRWLRHKTQKQPFGILLWGTILANIALCILLVWLNMAQ